MDIDCGRGEHCVCKTAASKPSSSLPEWVTLGSNRGIDYDANKLQEAIAIAWEYMNLGLTKCWCAEDRDAGVVKCLVCDYLETALRRIRELGETK